MGSEEERERERAMMVRRCRSFIFFFFLNYFLDASVVVFGFLFIVYC